MQSLHNPIWKAVLRHAKKLYLKCMPEDVHDCMLKCINYNVHIIIHNNINRVVHAKEWADGGVLQLRQLGNLDRHILTFAGLKQQFLMTTRTSVLVYEARRYSIQQFQESSIGIQVIGHDITG